MANGPGSALVPAVCLEMSSSSPSLRSGRPAAMSAIWGRFRAGFRNQFGIFCPAWLGGRVAAPGDRARTWRLRRAAGPFFGHAHRANHTVSAQRRRAPDRGLIPVEPARHPVLFVNPNSGGGKARRSRLADLARERGIEPVTLAGHDGLEARVQEVLAGGADALGVAGGDGSLGLVAAVGAAYGIPFVCVPAGTRNHFARDVGVSPDDLVGALDAFGAALERTIDLGYVNTRPFLNNVSLGIYGEAVQRAGYRDAKLRTLLETAEEEMHGSGSAPADVHLVDQRGHEHRSPAVVLVSNNPYVLGRRLGRRARPVLDSGRLGIVVIDAPAGPPQPAGRAWSAQSLTVQASRTIPAGVDGEAVPLAPPLHFTIQPRALRVRIAPKHVRRPPLSGAPVAI
jgi:diacylglycerol kinase family enzyme